MEIVAAPPAPLASPPATTSVLSRWEAMPVPARMRVGIGMAAVIAIIVAIMLWARQADYQVLYANLPDKEAGAVIAQLAQQNIPHKVGAGGVIMVPSDRVHDIRMRMATAGLPKSSVTGNELLDNPHLGQTDRQERLMLQRALEGELTRSIMQIDGVQEARVHLALPNQNGFFREQQQPGASVVLTLHPGYALARNQIAGIVHLVSSSVPEMNPKAVSVIDQSGTLLSGNKDDSQGGSLDEQQLAFVGQIESGYLKRVRDILEPLVGADNLRATVTADVDFTQSESTSERYRPNQGGEPQAVRSQQTNETNAAATGAGPTGIPGATSNQPPVPATAPINGASAPLQVAQGGGQPTSGGLQNLRRDAVTNYELDKTVQVTRHPVGAIKRLNVAVVVNYQSKTDAKGKTTTTPLGKDELDKLTTLVQEAVGFNKDRGDSVKVVNSAFQTQKVDEPVAVPLWKQPWLADLLRGGAVPAALALVALGLIFGIVKPALHAQRSALPAPQAQAQAIVSDDSTPLPSNQTPMLEAPREMRKLDDARQLARENPAAVANIMRDWVNGDSAA